MAASKTPTSDPGRPKVTGGRWWADQKRQRVAATADGRGPASGLVAKPQDGKSAEAFRFVVEEHLVEGGEAAEGCGLADGGRPDGVTGQRSDNRGLHSFAADVADDHAPVVRADLEDVIEVTPDLGAIARRAIDRRQVETGDLRVRRAG